MKESTGIKSYGNFIKIKHNNNYYTLYAHLDKGLKLKKGDFIKKGDIIGKMSDSGNAYGKHLHFEVYKNNNRIDPSVYLNHNFESSNAENIKYKIGDIVSIDGVYISSTSTKKLNPKIRKGKITRIINNARNPYLLDNGKIGWVGNRDIITIQNRYLLNNNYYGFSIVDGLNGIGYDSSFKNRKNLANLNGIQNYSGTSQENLRLLSLLKKGELIYK